MTPTEVFDNLLQLMFEDNGCRFTATEPQRMNGIAAITMLVQQGWNPEATQPGFDDPYTNDMEVLTQGEREDALAVVGKWGPPMQALHETLDAVFDNATA